MKKILISLAAASAVLIAGGDIAPVEPVVEVPMVVEQSPFYLGLGIGQSAVNDDPTQEEITSTSITLQAGYQYNQYIAVEGRVAFGFNSDYDPGLTSNVSGDFEDDIFSWGIYLKPMYPVTEEFNVYALLGYGGVQLGNLESGDAYESGFHWGLGASYDATERISVFVDYVQFYDGTGFDYRAQLEAVDSDAWTLGVSYKF